MGTTNVASRVVSLAGQVYGFKRLGVPLVLGLTILVLAGQALWRRSTPQLVLYTVSLPQDPYGVALDTLTGRAFVSGSSMASIAPGIGSVWMFDLRSGHLLRTIGPFSPNVEVTVVAALQRAFVIDDSGLVTMLDARSGRVLRTIAAGGDPTFAAVDLRHGWLDLTDPNADTVDVVDARTGQKVRSIYLAPFATPTGIWVDDRTGHAITANVGTKTVSIIDTARGVVLHTVATDPYPSVAVDGHGHIFATMPRGLVMVNATSGRALRAIAVHAVPGAAGTIAVDERSGHAFIAGIRTVNMVDTRTGRLLRTTPRNGAFLAGDVMAVDDRRDRVYLWDGDSVQVLDGQTGIAIRKVSLGLPADVVAISPRRQRVLVASTDPAGNTNGPATARLLDASTGKVLWSQRVGVGPVSLTVDDRAGYAFILTAGGTVASPDPLQWLPHWARRLPFLPAPPSPHTIPAQVTVLDLSS